MRKKAFQAAFPYTIPIFAGFWFLALAYGIYMNANVFSFVYPMLMSMLIYGGSLEFVAVEMLLSPFAPMQVFIMTLLIQARHIFYGIAMLDRFKGMGWKKFYLIFGMCDETFFSISSILEILIWSNRFCSPMERHCFRANRRREQKCSQVPCPEMPPMTACAYFPAALLRIMPYSRKMRQCQS